MSSYTIYMQRCLELAAMGKGHVAPNPMVGAVLVHNGRIIGEGWHKHYGQAHAEVNCLQNVAETDWQLIPESVMYVSLEPCAHYGKTPPCATRLVQEHVKEVIICNDDPFDKVAGRGMEILKQAGIPVTSGLLAPEGKWLNRRFFCFHEQQRPYIILKWAKTNNGFLAPADSSRMQLTGKPAQELVHKWRAEEAAIMVGTTTARNDNPQLTARLVQGAQPLRIVLDRQLTLPANLNIYANDAPTWIVNEGKETVEGHVSFIKLDFNNMLLEQLMHRLYNAGIQSVIVEGGARLLNSFIEIGLWDEARVFTAPVQLGNGIHAPVFNTNAVFKTAIGEDALKLYVNDKSNYPYVGGMEL